MIRWPSQAQLTAAAKMVIPRSRSCESKSVTVVPSWTSPRLYVDPVTYRIRSVMVVLPAVDVSEDAEVTDAGQRACGMRVQVGAHGPWPFGMIRSGQRNFRDEWARGQATWEPLIRRNLIGMFPTG